MGFTKFCCGFYLVLLGFTEFYWVILAFNWFYLVLFWVIPGFPEFYRVFTELDRILPRFSGFYWVSTSHFYVLLS